MVLVFPGCTEIFASFDHPVSMFISEDFPTFDLPMNPNSGLSEVGHSFNEGLLVINFAEWMIIL